MWQLASDTTKGLLGPRGPVSEVPIFLVMHMFHALSTSVGCTLRQITGVLGVITAARPAYAGTEGCYKMLVLFFYFIYLMRNL